MGLGCVKTPGYSAPLSGGRFFVIRNHVGKGALARQPARDAPLRPRSSANISVNQEMLGTGTTWSTFRSEPVDAPANHSADARPRERSSHVCDYSLHAVESRPAQIGEKLISTSFRRSSTSGFAAQDNRNVAVCLLPGTELAFDEEVRFYHRWIFAKRPGFRVARFCNVDRPDRHHDALEFPDGRKVLVTLLRCGQRAVVLQLPVGSSQPLVGQDRAGAGVVYEDPDHGVQRRVHSIDASKCVLTTSTELSCRRAMRCASSVAESCQISLINAP
jgi:hypothetical protein